MNKPRNVQQKKERRKRLELWTEWFLGRNKKPISKDAKNIRLKASDFQYY